MSMLAISNRPDPSARPAAGVESDQPSDDEICRGLQGGDARAAELVYERIVKVVDAVLYRLLGVGDPEREDLAQLAMERVIGTITSGRYLRDCSLSSWATLITQHLAIDTMRSRTRDRRVFDRYIGTEAVELVPDGRRTAEHFVDTQRHANRLRKALAAIPRSNSETVILHDVLGHNLAEVARLTGVSVAAAQSRLVRGRRKVMRLIGREDQSPRDDALEGNA
ncbi:MAG TPA: RNA polymerase sigma factor [Polyangia bacterium]|jgi:RNA polymerase sigma-70 factor (ECF subfamily)